MTEKQAFRIAIRALEMARQRIAFDANMAERAGATYREAVSALKERQRIDLAIGMLRDLSE